VLARYAAGVVIETEPRGKPFAHGAPAFSASSSGPLALVAVYGGARIGVDLEHRSGGAWDRMPEAQYLAPAEREALDALAAHERNYRAAALWVLKEAVAKAHGGGLALGPRELVLGGDWRRPAVAGWDATTPRTAAIVTATKDRIAAVAVDGPWEATVEHHWR
jgi:4'-phosphopantetheinyl transferase